MAARWPQTWEPREGEDPFRYEAEGPSKPTESEVRTAQQLKTLEPSPLQNRRMTNLVAKTREATAGGPSVPELIAKLPKYRAMQLHLATLDPIIRAKLVSLWSGMSSEELLRDVTLTPPERAREPSEEPSVPMLGPEIPEEMEEEGQREGSPSLEEAWRGALEQAQDIQLLGRDEVAAALEEVAAQAEAERFPMRTALGTPEDRARIAGLVSQVIEQARGEQQGRLGAAQTEGGAPPTTEAAAAGPNTTLPAQPPTTGPPAAAAVPRVPPPAGPPTPAAVPRVPPPAGPPTAAAVPRAPPPAGLPATAAGPRVPPPADPRRAARPRDGDEVQDVTFQMQLRQRAADLPLGPAPPFAVLMQQTEMMLQEADEVFSPSGYAEDYDGRIRVIHTGGQLPGAPDGQAIDFQHAQWLQEQGRNVPLYAGDDGEDRHVICEAGSWTTLAETIRHAPTPQEFSQHARNLHARSNILSADKVWAQADRVVWFNGSDYNSHGVNLFQLGRLKSFTSNSDGYVVKLLKTETRAGANEIIDGWRTEQARTNAPVTEYGHSDYIKSYNILPVTSALQLHIYPHWRRQAIDVYDPRQREKNPSYCGLAWDPQLETRPHDFTPGRYYFWLNGIGFQMAGWLCRGVADVPDDVIQSRALEGLNPAACSAVIRAYQAQAGQPSPDGHTRVVHREWMGDYFYDEDGGWRTQILRASRCNSIPYYMMDSSANAVPLALVPVNRSHPAPYGTWGYVFRQYRVNQTARRRFSVYDEATAILRRQPLPGDAIIGLGPGAGTRAPFYWANHWRPSDIQLPRHRFLERANADVTTLLPAEARLYVLETTAADPTVFDEPEEPWTRRDRSPSAVRPADLQRERGRDVEREQPPRLAAQRAAAAIQEVAVAETTPPPVFAAAGAPPVAERPAPRRPSRQPRPSPQRQPRTAALAPATDFDFDSLLGAATSATLADSLHRAILQLLGAATALPAITCPDPAWGTARQLTSELSAVIDLPPSGSPALAGNLPLVEALGHLITSTARVDAGMAAHLCAFLRRFLTGAAPVAAGAAAQPPPPGGRGPPPDDRGTESRGRPSSPSRRDHNGGRDGGRERRSPPPDGDPKRRRLGEGEQDATESRPRYRDRSPSPWAGPRPGGRAHRSSSARSLTPRGRPERSPSPPRRGRSPPRHRGRSPAARRRSDKRPQPTRARTASPDGGSRRPAPAPLPQVFPRSPPRDRYRSPAAEGRHQAAMASLRDAAAEPRHYKRGRGAEDTSLHYVGVDPTKKEARRFKPDAAVINRAVKHHIQTSLNNGDYDPPGAPSSRSPSPQPASPEHPPSPPRIGLAERFSKLPDLLQHLEDDTFADVASGPPRPPPPTNLAEANTALLLARLDKPAARATPALEAPAPTAPAVAAAPTLPTVVLPPPPPLLPAHLAGPPTPWPAQLTPDVAPAESSSPPRAAPPDERSPTTPTIPVPATRLEAATPALTQPEPLPGGTETALPIASADASTHATDSAASTPPTLSRPPPVDVSIPPLPDAVVSPAVGESKTPALADTPDADVRRSIPPGAPVKLKIKGPASSSHVSSDAPVSGVTVVPLSPAGNHVSESEPDRAAPPKPAIPEVPRDKKKKKRPAPTEDGSGEPLKTKKKKKDRRDKKERAVASAGPQTRARGATPSPPPTRRRRQEQLNADIQAAG